MTAQSVHKKLKLRRVTLEDIDQYNELLRYVFQVTGDEITDSGYEDENEIIRAKRPILKYANVFGWFNDAELVSQIAVYPCEVNIHGTIYLMGGVTGVGTYPEYAGRGLMRELISSALKSMREEGQYISYLYPYSIPLYRRKGWEIISDTMTYTLKDTQLPQIVPVTGYVERLDIDEPDVLAVYDQFARATHGAMIRGDLQWAEYWRWENEEERTAAVYYDEHDAPIGVCFYWLENEVFHIKEMVYLNQEARVGLWNFITAHFSMIDTVEGKNFSGEPIAFGLEDSDIVETIQPYYMARIVDVKEFLMRYPFIEAQQKPITLEILDPVAPWNQGIHTLSFLNGNLSISDQPCDHHVLMDIGTLTTLMMGYRSVTQLARAGRIKGSRDALRILKAYAIHEKAYFSDYF